MADNTGITVSDIAILESQRMTDDPDAGGAPTSRRIEDSTKNNIFPDVSRLDRAYGRVSMRKVFGGVQTASTETYHGVHAIVGERPQDDNVEILLFDTGGDPYDERAEARSHVEAYLIADEVRRYHIYGRHLAGMTSLQVSAPTSETQPSVGETLALEHDDGTTEYIRVAGASSEIEEHTVDGETFSRRTITISTARPLPRDYDGADPQPIWEDHGSPVTIRGMRVADAARYYGATETATEIQAGDSYVDLLDLYAQIVPTTEREEIISDRQALSDLTMEVEAGGDVLEVPTHVHTFFLGVSQETRGFSWTAYLRPLPEPGTLRIYWQGLGNWELIQDADGNGELTGRGSGTVDYDTGAVVFTTLELPDTPSEIMLQWGSEAQYRDRSGRTVSTGNNPPQMTFAAGDPIQPGSLTVTWLAGDTERQATDDGEGTLSGDGTGRVAYTSGDIAIVPDQYADPGTKVRVEYSRSQRRTEVIDPANPPDGAQIPAGAKPGAGRDGADGRLTPPSEGGDEDKATDGTVTDGTKTDSTEKDKVHRGSEVPTISYTVEHPPIKPHSLTLRWTVGRSAEFREHFLDFSSREHALKEILGRDRERESEVPMGVQAGDEHDLPGGAKHVLRVEDANGDEILSDWWESVKEDADVEGYRPVTKVVWQDGIMDGEVHTDEEDILAQNDVDQAEPGGVYTFIGHPHFAGVAVVIANSGVAIPRTYWSIIGGAMRFWSVDELQLGTAQDIPIDDPQAIHYVEDAQGRRLAESQWEADLSAGTWTLLDDQLPSGNAETVTQTETTPGLNDRGRQDYLTLTLDAHSSGLVTSVDDVRDSGTSLDRKRVERASGTANVTVYDAIEVHSDESIWMDYTDTDGTEHTGVELPSTEGWQDVGHTIDHIDAVYVGPSYSDAGEIAVGGLETDGTQVWLPTAIDAAGIHTDDARDLAIDYTVDHQGDQVATPLKVAVGVDAIEAYYYLELSPDLDPDIYDLSYLHVAYAYDVTHEEPLTVVYRPEDAEEEAVLQRTLFSAYLATVNDLDDEDLFSQEVEVGEYVREAVDDGETPVGNLSYKADGDPIEGGVDYDTGEITWRPTAQYSYTRTKDRVREEFGRIVQTAPYTGSKSGGM